MGQLLPQCQLLQDQVSQLLGLLGQEPSLRTQVDTTAVQTSLRKAIASTFEIVFAGAFSAGKSMLINALLEQELLYSAEGHATGTECRIAYAPADQERVVLTFLSEAEIREQVTALCQKLGLTDAQGINLNRADSISALQQQCQQIIEQEGGRSKSERAKQASALDLLLAGFVHNRDRIHTVQNNTFPMEQFGFETLQKAAEYARRGANSAVLKRIEYYCHHPLLEEGNIIVDTPGIDAPVKRDVELTYRKIEDPDTSAVICVLKPASVGELTPAETELLENTRNNPSVRDRVFYVFNRIDETWYNTQLRQRLDRLIQEQFRDHSRVYKTSGLLGFYGSLLRQTGRHDRFGLDSLFAESVKGVGGVEETPQFVNEFNRYCASSSKLPADRFRIEVKSYESPNENYVRILSEQGNPLIEHLIQDSGIEDFRTAITRYLTEEKRPQLIENLADDLQPICIRLKRLYVEAWQVLDSQPQDIEVIKEQKLKQLSHDLKRLGDALQQDIAAKVNEAVASNANKSLETSYTVLKSQMIARLDELLHTFDVATVHQRAQASHPRNSVVPLLAILAEAFYYLANGLEEVLVNASQVLIREFFRQLMDHIRKQDYYLEIYRVLGNDGGIEKSLLALQTQVEAALVNEARTECDRYVRERPEFYTEGTISLWQLRQTLQQACRGYDYQSMIEAEPAIRQLLKLDFEYKVGETVTRTFRQTINQTLNVHLLQRSAEQADLIIQQYDQARTYLAQTLDKEAAEKIRKNQVEQAALKQKIDAYNAAIAGINNCLAAMALDRKKLPLITESDLAVIPPMPEDVLSEMSAVNEAEVAAVEAVAIEV